MAKMGRPLKEIDIQQFEKLCGLQCTEEEIASFFDCHIDTLNAWCKRTYDATFSEVYKVKASSGKISLRRHQFKLAEKSAAMAIFLGKNILGQKDDKFETQSAEANGILESIADVLKRRENDDSME